MRTVFLCLFALGLTIVVVNGQDKVVTAGPFVHIDDTPPTAILKASKIETRVIPVVSSDKATVIMTSQVVAKGDVEIRIGQSIITADEAEIRYSAPGELDDIELRGNVRLKAHLKVE